MYNFALEAFIGVGEEQEKNGRVFRDVQLNKHVMETAAHRAR